MHEKKINLKHLHLSLAWADETAINRTTDATNKLFILERSIVLQIEKNELDFVRRLRVHRSND